jgi:tRNA (guanine-N1)-methyltransferase
MKIDILTLFPEMFNGFLTTSIIKRAIDKKRVQINLHNFREYSIDKHNKVDDYPYGGGRGMVLMCQPVLDCLKAISTKESYVILMSPQGISFKQEVAKKLAINKNHLILICGHYEGFDERIRNYVDLEISLGDYVLTGGELASMVISDAIIRLLDGVIFEDSHQFDSFSNDLLEHPHYTRPYEYDGLIVPKVLISGHHENIRKYRIKESLKRTLERRPDLLESKALNQEEKKMVDELLNNDYEKEGI